MVYQRLCQRTIQSVSLSLLAVGVASAVRAQPSPTPIASGTALDTIVRRNLDGDYVLTAPIYLNETNEGQWTPIGDLSRPFNGTLDGNGHIIYGLNVITRNDSMPTGLFGKIQDSWIRRLVLDRPFIQSSGKKSHIGSVAGVAERSNITDSVNLFGVVRSYGGGIRTGGITGWSSNSTISGNLNTGTVSSRGSYAHTGGSVGSTYKSTVSGNLNTGAVSSNGSRADTGGTAGFAWSSTVSHNLNTGAVSSRGFDTGGTVGFAWSSTVSHNLNTGTVSSNGYGDHTGGTNGEAWSSTISGNLNTGAVSSNGTDADTGGTAGYAWYSTFSGNLNTRKVSSNGTGANTGGTTGAASYSTVSHNLNTGTVSSNGAGADTGGTTGSAYGSTVISHNLNNGAVSSKGSEAGTGGTAGIAEYDSTARYNPTVSHNLNTGIVTSQLGAINTLGFLNLTETQIQSGNNELNDTVWNNGMDTQYPMPVGVNAAYWDLRRINGTQNGNSINTFPAALGEFADPGGLMNASLFDQAVWNVRDGYLPFLKHISRQVAEQAGIHCGPGGFACSESANCLFTARSPGTLEYLLYDGQRYHGVVKSGGSGLAYWIAYEDNRRLALWPCEVYGFTDISSAGIVVDAAVNQGNSAYVAYHIPTPGQAQPDNSMLAILTLSGGQPQPTLLPIKLDGQVTSLSIDGDDVLVNTGQAIERLSRSDTGSYNLMPGLGSHALRTSEVIQLVAGNNGDFYLLTHELGTGYRIRAVPESGAATFLMVTTPSGVTTSKKVVASLKVSGERLHLLMIDSRSIIWRKYRLDTLANAPEEAQESEAFATLRNITPAAIAPIPINAVDTGTVKESVFLLGQTGGLPQYIQLMPTDFTFSPDSNGDNGYGIGAWSWWAKTLFGTGISVTGLAVLTTISCLVKKGWDHYRPRGGKPDIFHRIYQQTKRQNQRSTQDRQTQPRAGLPLSGILSRPGFRGNPDGSNAISVEPVYIQPNGLGQTPLGYLEVMPSETQPYLQPIALYEKVPRKKRVPQISPPSRNPNEVHVYEDLGAVEVRATEQRHEYYELEPVQRLNK